MVCTGRRRLLALVTGLLVAASTARADAPRRQVEEALAIWRGEVTASWYGPGFHGRRAACGRIYDQWASTVATRDLPCGARLRITNLANRRSELVEVTDRGPYIRGRAIDVSRGVARRLGFERQGLARVLVEVLR